MAQPAHVPKFGNWEDTNDVPYTMVFDTARTGKGNVKPINPNDPLENPAAFGLKAPPPQPQAPQKKIQPQPDKNPAHIPQFGRWNDSDETPFTMVFDNARAGKGNTKTSNPSIPLENAKVSVAPQSKNKPSNGTVDPKHPTSIPQFGDWHENDETPYTLVFDKAKAQNLQNNKTASTEHDQHDDQNPASRRLSGNANRPMEKKSPPEGGRMFAPGAPGRGVRPSTPSRGDELSDKGAAAALPKFGVWNDNQGNGGEGFTVIFDQARNMRKAGGVTPTRTPPNTYPSPNPYKPQPKQPKAFWACLFGSPTKD